MTRDELRAAVMRALDQPHYRDLSLGDRRNIATDVVHEALGPLEKLGVTCRRRATALSTRAARARANAEEDAGTTTMLCGKKMRSDGPGWAWRREEVTCPDCLAGMDRGER